MSSHLIADLIAAARVLRQRTGFALTVVVTLGLGIAINAAVFAVVRAALFSGYAHVERNDRIVRIATTRGYVYYPDFEAWRARTTTLEDVALTRGVFHTVSDGNSTLETYFTTEVTANTFRLLRVRPLLGRDFVSADHEPGAEPVVILRFELWQRAFGASADAIGKVVRIDGQPARIIGVMPPGFTFPSTQELWMPLKPTAAARQRQTGYAPFAYARLRDGADVERAREEMAAIGAILAREHPRTNVGMTPVLQPFEAWFVDPSTKALYTTVWIAAVIVLVVLCANLASMMRERAAARSREIAIRLALGAGQLRLIRQLTLETLILTGIGALIAWPVGRALLALYQNAASGNRSVLNVTMGVSDFLLLLTAGVAAGVLASVGAAVHSIRLNIKGTLTSRTESIRGTARWSALPDVSLVLQVAVAVVLMTTAGFLIRGYQTLVTVDIGADTTDVITMSLYAPPERYVTPESRLRFYDTVAERLRAIAGVSSVGFGTAAPTEFTPQVSYSLVDDEVTDATTRPVVSEFVVTPTYFRTLRVPVLRGRPFNETDQVDAIPVAIVNQEFSRRAWLDGTAVGKRIRLTTPGKEPGPWLTIVGTVANVMQNERTRRSFEPIVYVPYSQRRQPNMFAFIRAAFDAERVIAPIRREMYDINPDIPAPALATLSDRYARTYAVERQSSVVVTSFATITLLIAVLGLHAALSQSVRDRTQEIGIRRAIGATAADVVTAVSTRVSYSVVIGSVLGTLLSIGSAQATHALTINVSTIDAAVVLPVASVLLLSALLGCLGPIVRATRVDPAVALRRE